jgi:hypothetical protein
MTRLRIKPFFNIYDQKEFLRYRFELLKQWMKQHENYSKSYIEALDSLIDRLYLRDEFNSYENVYV